MLRFYFLFLLLILFGTGCQDDSLDRELPAEIKIQLALQFTYDTPFPVDSRAISQNGADTSGISDLNIFIFDANGNLLQQQYTTGTNSTVTITTTSGQRNVAVIANAATNLNTITTLTQLQALYTQISPASGMMNASLKLPMAAQTGTITIPAPSTPGGSVSIPTIYLTRLYTKVTTTFSYALNPGVSITPTKITLCQVPNSCNYFASNTPASNTQILARGDSLYSGGSRITSQSHSTAVPLYLYENLQGNNGSNTQQSQKTPATGKSGFCSYIEVTANYSSPTQSGPIIYRYYLGTNTLTNFDVARNTWHQVSITFNGNGGITENSWRVNVTGLYNTVLPPTLYFPYYAGRSQIYNFKQTELSTTLNRLSSSTQAGVVLDSNLYIISKTDNGTTPNTLGTVTTENNSYTVTMQAKGTSEFFVDVSMLDFPQNTTFGFTNYPITQYIQILNAGTSIGTWTARSTASWLYIGNGNDFPVFSASGTAYPWSTTSPVTTGSNMYNSTGGVIQGSTTPAALAVRCTANTGANRTAYIIFTAGNNQEVARVFVSQNPSTYPQSAVGLRYVTGGVFQPGAFTSSGATASPQPDGSSTSQIYVRTTPFYIATKECTVQNFSDYLNDLGVNNVSQLSGQASTALDKTGLIGDYPGTLLTLLVGNVFSPGNGGPSYSGSKWNVPTQAIRLNGSTTTTVTGWIGNFPMSNISFYGAYDYGYWMNKKSNVGTASRSTTRGIPSEMQWETAARAINNNFTTQAAYTASSSTTKNGLFPYAFPSQTYNSGLTGKENTNNDLLKSISLYSSFSNLLSGTIVFGSTTYLLPSGNLIPNSLYIYDLSGNVQEWTLDTYTGQNLGFSLLGLVTSPVNLILSANRVVKGGNSTVQASYCSNSYRASLDGNTLNNQTGIRAVINVN